MALILSINCGLYASISIGLPWPRCATNMQEENVYSTELCRRKCKWEVICILPYSVVLCFRRQEMNDDDFRKHLKSKVRTASVSKPFPFLFRNSLYLPLLQKRHSINLWQQDTGLAIREGAQPAQQLNHHIFQTHYFSFLT